MYLKRLELHGFKTFASRTVLDFEGGVTGVVGPNGSGKSNLVDAVRWALGEQSMRNVRCRQAEDLIFAGTTASGPTASGPKASASSVSRQGCGSATRGTSRAPMGMAEVMLTFDNSAGWLPIDYQDVSIGRRVYRSGENEYLMNGAKVRLRDITDLLARVGVGSGNHLVIGQGLVDTMLSARPEERRALVETLAGLRFYYNRREDAETKLKATEANLHNVDAMIAEATPHLAVLRAQADAYNAYREVERELHDLLLLHYAHAYSGVAARGARLAAELTEARDAVTAARDAVAAAEGELLETREHAGTRRRAVSDVRGALRGVHEARESAVRELAVGRARREGATARLNDVRGGLPAIEARHKEAVEEKEGASARERAVAEERARLDATRATIEETVRVANVRVAESERATRALAERRRALEGRAAAIAAEEGALARAEETARAEESRLAADEQATARGWTEARGDVALARAALEQGAAALEQAREEESKARLLAAAAGERARDAATAQREAQRGAAETSARADGLRAWLHSGGGGKTGGVTVAASLVTDARSGPALAAALGPLLAARIAKPGADARGAATILAEGARGVLLAGRGGLTAERQKQVITAIVDGGVDRADVVGWGDALTTVEAEAEALTTIRAALSTVLVVPDLDAAWRAHAALGACPDGGAITLATLQGESLAPSGLLQRPAGEGAAALERARQLRETERAAADLERQVAAATTAAEQAERERVRSSTTAEAALRALRAAERERDTRRGALTAAERTEAQAQREAQWAAERTRRATTEAIARGEQRGTLTQRAAEAHAQLVALATDEQKATRGYDEARAALQKATAARAEHGAGLALISERTTDAARRKRAATEALARIDADLQRATTTVARLETELHDSRADEEGLEARTRDAAAQVQALHEQLRPIEAELARLDERTAELERRLSEARPAEARVSAAHEAAALASQRAAHERETLLAGLQTDLGLAPEDLPEAKDAPPSGLHGRVKSLRSKLASFGPVNARAPEDLAAAAERQEFLQGQVVDLREGIARLRAIITEANGTVRERFGAVAGELDAQFRLYLQQLFGGGRGELTALYDEAGLPSGLDIAVQPPGKRTKDLQLLSGGERALVGLALVFAMLAVRPVPFCVLDEAEAALDEANTLRVGEALRALSAQTQFIVVTHNRGTMSQADSLYGVTMAESGVSQVAGLRLEDVEVVRQSRAG